MAFPSLTDQRLFYYSGNLKITNIQYNYEMARRSSGRFRDLSDMIEKLVSQDLSPLPFQTSQW